MDPGNSARLVNFCEAVLSPISHRVKQSVAAGHDLGPATRGRIFETWLDEVYKVFEPFIEPVASYAINPALGPVHITGAPGTLVRRTYLGMFTVQDVWLAYATDADVTLDASGQATVGCRCTSNGTIANQPEGTELRMLPAQAGVNTAVFAVAPGINVPV